MTQEQIKAKAKEYFPNDEFKRQIVIDAINWATEELQKENAELKEQIAELSKHIVELQKDKGELIDRCRELEETNAVLERRIERSKECMKKLLFIINSDPANYNCKGLVKDAEDFIHNRTCNIRQQGQHCISETRCIMCDKEIKEK